MEPTSWLTLVTATTASASNLLNDRKREAFIAFFKSITSKRKVLVLGASGVGKSQLTTSLVDICLNRRNTIVKGYQGTITTQKIDFRFKDTPFTIIDTAGHEGFKSNRIDTIRECLNTGVSCIFNVVSYGFIERGGSTDKILSESNLPLDTYLNDGKKEEIKLLGEWVDLIDNKITKFVVTIINKADLWWGEADEVKAYYESGDYYKALGDLPQKITHVVLPYCSIINLFYGKYNPGIMGEPLKQSIQNSFIDQLLSITRKKQ